MLDKQKVLEFVVEKLIQQNKKCTNLMSTKCVFRNEAGDKCAIGQLILDEDYQADFDNSMIGPRYVLKNINLDRFDTTGEYIYSDADMDFFEALREIHDFASITNFKESLIENTKEELSYFGLDLKFLEKYS